MPSTYPRSTRRVSAIVAVVSLATLWSFGSIPANAADAPWSPPVPVADAYGDATATVVAPDGSITTVSETALGIMAVTSNDAGATWQPSVLLGSGGDYAFRPAIGVTSSGLRAAAWVEELAGNRAIYVVISADGGATWSSPDPLPIVGSYVDDPVVASSSASGFTIAWNEDFDKYASSSFDGGATWGAAENLTIAMNSYGSTTLVPNGAGQIVAIFQEFDGNTAQYSLKSKQSTDGGLSWGVTVPVSGDWSGSFGSSVYLGGVSPSTGNVVTLWSHGTSGGSDALFAATSSDGGATWDAPVTVFSGADYLRNFRVQAIDSTSAGIVWYYEVGLTTVLSYSTLAVGASAASVPVTIESTSAVYFERQPSFSTLGSSRVVSWYENGATAATSGYRVSASCDSGATWTPPVTLDLGGDVASNDATTVVSGTTFTGIWTVDTDSPSGQSLQAASTTTPCNVAAAAVPGALAATGIELSPLLALALAALALGAALVVTRRRSALS